MEQIDNILFKLVIILLVLLLVIQSVLTLVPQTGIYLNTALRLEGIPLKDSDLVRITGEIAPAPWASVSLKLLDYMSLSQVKILVDGREVGSFIKNEVTINIKNGNIIVIENPFPDTPITVIISRHTQNVIQPAANTSIMGTGRLYFQPVAIR